MDAIERKILAGGVPAGQKLPPEAELARQLGVGRRLVREALKALELKGLVEIKMGVGTIVRRNDLDKFLDGLARNIRSYAQTRKAATRHVAELRNMLEGAAAARAATAPDPELLATLRSAVADQRKALENTKVAPYQEAHQQFHFELVGVLANPIASMIHRQLLELMYQPMSKSAAAEGVMAKAIEEHTGILDAIESGDAGEAREQVRLHLERFVERVG